MSVMDKLINAMKINDDPYDDEPDDDYYEDEEEDIEEEDSREEEEEEVPAPRQVRRRASAIEKEPAPARTVRRSMGDSGMEVCVLKPQNVNDARDITDTLLMGSTVVLNLEGLDVEIAQRIIDFTSGSCYAIKGNVMKISHYIFVITPANVDISGDISTASSMKEASMNLTSPFAAKTSPFSPGTQG